MADPQLGSPVQTGDVIADKYMVVRVLAAGGMGIVVAARHQQLGRMVAIKLLREGMSSRGDMLARFEREARIVAGLTGEHVAQVFDVGRLPSGEPFIVMELLDGETLGERLRRVGKLAVSEVATFLLQACDGLAEAHAAGVVHRDLKPANIFVSRRVDGSETVKLLDFGISKVRESASALTHTVDMIGTPAYMAPEQLEDPASVDVRADVWSLGAVLYEALAGRRAFGTEGGVVSAVSSVIRASPTPLSENDGVPAELYAVVKRCLTKAAADRFPTIADLARALAPYAIGDTAPMLERIDKLMLHPPPSSGSPFPELLPLSEGTRGARQRAVIRANLPNPAEPTRSEATPPPPSRRGILGLGIAAGASVALGAVFLSRRARETGGNAASAASQEAPGPLASSAPPLVPGAAGAPLRVGVLHSLTGTMAASEAPLVDAALLAIARVNAAGGLLGRPVEAIVRDGRSRAETFVEESRRLLDEDGVPVVFGCWTSTSRRAVRPIYEERGKLLVYSVQYEGLEESPAIIYLGAAPNQQLIPAVRWAFAFLGGKRPFLVGSDYVFPRVATEILKDELHVLGAKVAGEAFLPLGSTDVAGVVQQIKSSGATLILNTINGDTNLAFLRALRAAGIRSETTPTLSFSLDQSTYRDLDPAIVAGDYMAWNYFEAFDSADNRQFLRELHERIGPRPATDPMATTYSAVLLWAEAVRQAGSVDLAAVRGALGNVRVSTPLGELRVTPSNGHAVKIVAVGQIGPDGKVQVVWSAPRPVEAVPFPETRSREEWEKLLARLEREWGGKWERPQKGG